MTVRVVTTGYGASALAALRDVATTAKADDPMAQVTVIAPNNIAGITARRHLAGGRGIAGIEVTTLARLAERIAAPALAPRRPATRPVMAAAWRRALAGAPGQFSDIAEHPATVRALADAHVELRDLTAAGRAAVRDATSVGADLVALHETVARKMEAAWYDATDVLTTAAGQVAAIAGTLGTCILYLPQRLSQAETRFARALADASELIVIVGLTGVARADQAVHACLAALGLTAGDGPRPPVAARVLNASDSDDEVRCVVRDVVETLKSTPARRVAVLYANPAPYARLLHEHLAAAGITTNGPGMRPADERAVARALLEILSLADRDVPRAELFQALASAPVRDFAGARIPVSRWERISRSAGVVAGDDWANRIDAYVGEQQAQASAEVASDDPRDWLVNKLGRDIDVATALRAFACQLRRELQDAQQLTTWRALADWCLGFFTLLLGADDTVNKLPSEEQYAAATVVTTLRSLANLDAVDAAASFDTLRDVLTLELAGTLPRVGRFGEGVFVAPISAAIGLDLDVAYLCGLSEDVYPGRLRADALLPERARRATNGELPSTRERIDARHRQLLAGFAVAQVEAVASFPRGDLRRSTQRLPSRFLLPSLRELSGDKSLAATAWHEPRYDERLTTAGSFAGELLQTQHLATEQEWRTREASARRTLEDDTVTAAVAMIRARAGNDLTRYDGNLTGVTGLPDYAVDERLISPTALESYAKCPHAFFVERLLGVQQLEQPEDIVQISPMDVGNLMHQSVEALVTDQAAHLPGFGQPWTDTQRDRFVHLVDATADEFERRGLTGHPRLWARERVRVIDDALWLLADDNAWRAQLNAAVRASELPFGMRGQPPVEIAVAAGRVLMRGSADKIDVGADDTIYVTDIKTGSQRGFEDIAQATPLAAGTKLQLPVYAYAARARFGTAATPVHTTYWFVRRDRGRRGIDLTPEVESRYADTVGTLVASIARGLFPLRAPDAPDFLWVQCDYCNPDGIGHVENRDSWLRKRHDPALLDLVTLIEPDALAENGAG